MCACGILQLNRIAFSEISGSTLKMDTYTRIGDLFYCKRHAADHQEKVVQKTSKASEGGESKVASKFKVERDMCPVCDKAVYATEKLIVSDTFASKVLHKTCFKCATCKSQLNMRTYVSVEDKYYCKVTLDI